MNYLKELFLIKLLDINRNLQKQFIEEFDL